MDEKDSWARVTWDLDTIWIFSIATMLANQHRHTDSKIRYSEAKRARASTRFQVTGNNYNPSLAAVTVITVIGRTSDWEVYVALHFSIKVFRPLDNHQMRREVHTPCQRGSRHQNLEAYRCRYGARAGEVTIYTTQYYIPGSVVSMCMRSVRNLYKELSITIKHVASARTDSS